MYDGGAHRRKALSRHAPVLLGFGIAVFGAASLCRASAGEDVEVGQVIEKVRRAMGYGALVRQESGVLAKGRGVYSGVEVNFSLMFTPEGAFLQTIDGKLHETYGFDGKTGWSVDWSGVPRILEMEQLEATQLEVWVQTGRWLAPDGPFAVSVIDEKTSEREVTVSLRLTAGLLEAELVIDRSSWLPVAMRRRSASGEASWRFEDYPETMGFRLPHNVRHSTGAGQTDSYTIQSVGPAPQFFRNPYAPMMARPDNTRFDSAVSSAVELKRVPTGHLLVQPRVNGKHIGWFILDSGAGALAISPKAADAAKMPVFGGVALVASGGSTTSKLREGERFELGPLSFTRPVFVELDLDFLVPAFGLEVVGVCGYEVFSRAVVEIDPGKDVIGLYDPQHYQLERGTWRELFLDNKLPCVRCTYEGDRSGLFRLDTGAGATVIFHSPAVEKFRLLAGRETTEFTFNEAGGAHSALVGRIEWFEMAGHRFEQLKAAFSQAGAGPFSSPYTAGTVGMGVLAPFKMVFDYPHRRIAFIKQGKG